MKLFTRYLEFFTNAFFLKLEWIDVAILAITAATAAYSYSESESAKKKAKASQDRQTESFNKLAELRDAEYNDYQEHYEPISRLFGSDVFDFNHAPSGEFEYKTASGEPFDYDSYVDDFNKYNITQNDESDAAFINHNTFEYFLRRQQQNESGNTLTVPSLADLEKNGYIKKEYAPGGTFLKTIPRDEYEAKIAGSAELIAASNRNTLLAHSDPSTIGNQAFLANTQDLMNTNSSNRSLGITTSKMLSERDQIAKGLSYIGTGKGLPTQAAIGLNSAQNYFSQQTEQAINQEYQAGLQIGQNSANILNSYSAGSKLGASFRK